MQAFGICKPIAEKSSVGIEEIKLIKPKYPRVIRTVWQTLPSNQRPTHKNQWVMWRCIRIREILIQAAKVHIPESVVDRARRIDYRYLDACPNIYCKSIIIRFTTFRHRTTLYRAKNKLKRAVRIKLDLTKSRSDLLKRTNDNVKELPSIKFCFADINCRLKVKFNDEN